MIEQFTRYQPDAPDTNTFDKINEIIKVVNDLDQLDALSLRVEESLQKVIGNLDERLKKVEAITAQQRPGSTASP